MCVEETSDLEMLRMSPGLSPFFLRKEEESTGEKRGTWQTPAFFCVSSSLNRMLYSFLMLFSFDSYFYFQNDFSFIYSFLGIRELSPAQLKNVSTWRVVFAFLLSQALAEIVKNIVGRRSKL